MGRYYRHTQQCNSWTPIVARLMCSSRGSSSARERTGFSTRCRPSGPWIRYKWKKIRKHTSLPSRSSSRLNGRMSRSASSSRSNTQRNTFITQTRHCSTWTRAWIIWARSRRSTSHSSRISSKSLHFRHTSRRTPSSSSGLWNFPTLSSTSCKRNNERASFNSIPIFSNNTVSKSRRRSEYRRT